MSDVHPALEAVAREICKEGTGFEHDWVAYISKARAALNALIANAAIDPKNARLIREIAAEPKPTVEGVLHEHRWMAACRRRGCWNGEGEVSHYAHTVDMLREAGLLKEDA